MRILDLSGYCGVTSVGWEALVDVLCNADSALELLDLSHNAIDNQVMVSFADALANNNILKGLMLGSFDIIGLIEAAFTRILCPITLFRTSPVKNFAVNCLQA